MSQKRRELLLNSGQVLSKSFSLPNNKSSDNLSNADESPKKRGRKKGSKNRKKADDGGFPTLVQDFTEESFLDRQKRLKASAPENENESFLGGATDRRKKNEIYNQLNEYEKDRFTRLDKAKIPEKHIKRIVNRVLGTDVHINKTMLKIIGGIAKVYVGELVEEAKIAQVTEEYEIREKLGLNERFKSNNNQNDDEDNDEDNDDDIEVDSDSRTPDKQTKKDCKDGSDNKQSSKDQINSDKESPDKSLSSPDKEETKQVKSELIRDPNRPEETEDDILKSTLHNDVPLMPRHLRIARDEYEKKRMDSKLRIL